MKKGKTKKVNHSYKCQECGKPATYNLQGGGWKLWTIDNKGSFQEYNSWGLSDVENSFYCDKCAKKEEII